MNLLNLKQNPLILQNIGEFTFKTLLFIKTELKKNRITFILPLPLLLISWIVLLIKGTGAFKLDTTGALLYLIILFFLALVYGLQCFSGEADRKTLDFLLTKPISPVLLLSVKYFLSLSIFLIWLLWSQSLFNVTLAKLELPKEMSFQWVLLIIIMVHAMSCFAGLLARGLERFFAILVVTGSVAGLSYFIWWQFFKLIQANYYLPDIPPNLNTLVMNILPIIFATLGIAVPFVGTLWIMKNRIKLWRFKPALWTIGMWLLAYLILVFTENFFGPVLWPDKTAKYGDWHQTTGIILAGPLNSKFEFGNLAFKKQRSAWVLTLTIPGHRSRVIYHGNNLFKPKFSPDGRKIVFSEDNILKILDVHSKQTQVIGPGKVASWASNGKKLICAQQTGEKGQSKIYIYNLIARIKKDVPGIYNAVDLVWDSPHDKLYIFEYKTDLKVLDLKNYQQSTLIFESKNLFPFGIFPPNSVLYSSLNRIYFGQVLGQRLLYYFVDLRTKKIIIEEEKMDIRIKSSAPLLIRSTPTHILWPRVDGGFVYQTTDLNIGIHHHHSKNEANEDH